MNSQSPMIQMSRPLKARRLTQPHLGHKKSLLTRQLKGQKPPSLQPGMLDGQAQTGASPMPEKCHSAFYQMS